MKLQILRWKMSFHGGSPRASSTLETEVALNSL